MDVDYWMGVIQNIELARNATIPQTGTLTIGKTAGFDDSSRGYSKGIDYTIVDGEILCSGVVCGVIENNGLYRIDIDTPPTQLAFDNSDNNAFDELSTGVSTRDSSSSFLVSLGSSQPAIASSAAIGHGNLSPLDSWAPRLRERWESLLRLVRRSGIGILSGKDEGYRTPWHQTQVAGTASWASTHQYGLGFDVTVISPEGAIDGPDDIKYAGMLAKRLDLDWGYEMLSKADERKHFNWPGLQGNRVPHDVSNETYFPITQSMTNPSKTSLADTYAKAVNEDWSFSNINESAYRL